MFDNDVYPLEQVKWRLPSYGSGLGADDAICSVAAVAVRSAEADFFGG
jgi:hypothetical protein